MKYFVDFDAPECPIIGLEDEYAPGFVDPSHCHSRDQLLYASGGVMSVTTAKASFVIPPQRAIWIPRYVEHEVSCRGDVSLRTLYFSEERARGGECRVIEVTDLLKALIVEVARLGPVYAPNGRNAKLIDLLLAELDTMPIAPFQAPMPRDYRLLRVCRTIIDDPASQHDLDALASIAGMGRRTLTRAFRAETGMSLAIWRQQVRLMEALSLLAVGRTVTTVAFDVGYDSPSAFTAMFHRSFGVPPSQYQPRA
jgi:AraC-like DNA-binding protein